MLELRLNSRFSIRTKGERCTKHLSRNARRWRFGRRRRRSKRDSFDFVAAEFLHIRVKRHQTKCDQDREQESPDVFRNRCGPGFLGWRLREIHMQISMSIFPAHMRDIPDAERRWRP